MNKAMVLFGSLALAASTLIAQSAAPAATPAAAMKPKKPVYVQDFVGTYEPAQSSQTRSGPLSRSCARSRHSPFHFRRSYGFGSESWTFALRSPIAWAPKSRFAGEDGSPA